MSESDEYYCPNPFCPIEKLTVGEKACPECGAYAQKIQGKELAKLLPQKRAFSLRQKKETETAQASRQDEKILYSDEMTDDQIRSLISQDVSNLAIDESETASPSPDAAVSSKTTDQMTRLGLKTLADQNRIMIRQNELIIRSLKRLTEKMDESRR
jgi:hypothetical protein